MLDGCVCYRPSRSSIALLIYTIFVMECRSYALPPHSEHSQPANTLSTTLTCSINTSSLSRRPMSCTWQGAFSTSLGRSVPVSGHDLPILNTVDLFLTRRSVLDVSHKLGVGSLIRFTKGDGAGRVLIHRQHHTSKNKEGSKRGSENTSTKFGNIVYTGTR